MSDSSDSGPQIIFSPVTPTAGSPLSISVSPWPSGTTEIKVTLTWNPDTLPPTVVTLTSSTQPVTITVPEGATWIEAKADHDAVDDHGAGINP